MKIKIATLNNIEKNNLFIKLFFLLSMLFNNYDLFAQEIKNEEKISKLYFLDTKKYNYTKTTDAALDYIKSYFNNDAQKYSVIIEKIKEIEKNQIYFLSLDEYKPIKAKIDSMSSYQNLPIEEYEMIKNHIKYLNFHYKSVEELLK
jgi:hypothetical protein